MSNESLIQELKSASWNPAGYKQMVVTFEDLERIIRSHSPSEIPSDAYSLIIKFRLKLYTAHTPNTYEEGWNKGILKCIEILEKEWGEISVKEFRTAHAGSTDTPTPFNGGVGSPKRESGEVSLSFYREVQRRINAEHGGEANVETITEIVLQELKHNSIEDGASNGK